MDSTQLTLAIFSLGYITGVLALMGIRRIFIELDILFKNNKLGRIKKK